MDSFTRIEWISKRDRLPERGDADIQGCVLAWHIYNGMMVAEYHECIRSDFISHWAPKILGP
jgi:hypothetical protein